MAEAEQNRATETRHTRFAPVRRHLEAVETAGGLTAAVYEFMLFGFKQAWACLFGALMLLLLLASHFLYPAHAPLARYDALTLAAVAIQLALLGLRMETLAEAKVILAFHLVGTAMEVFKTRMGSWEYPEPGLLRIGAVPLFSGFMYASVGSYIARVWRIFHFRFSRYPPPMLTWLLAAGVYVNFFTHHWVVDMRIGLFAAAALIWGRTTIWYTPWRQPRHMPLLLGLLLVALFIWLGEQLGTFSHAWIYPAQRHGWSAVPIGKLGAWSLLIIISFVLVTLVHPIETITAGARRRPPSGVPRPSYPGS